MLREDVLIQCFVYERKIVKVFRCQFFVGCIDKFTVRCVRPQAIPRRPSPADESAPAARPARARPRARPPAL